MPVDVQGRYYLWNIGCQMNQADAWRLAEALERRGLRPTRDPREAKLMILNTCVVRQNAEDKVVGRLSSLRPLAESDGRLLLVMGCFVGDQASLHREYPFVDRFLPPSDLDGVLASVDAFLAENGDLETKRNPKAAQISDMVPISYGCDHHCTYCIVTIRRGPQRSRPIQEIVADARDLVARGAREITLLGQNVDAYGNDREGGPSDADLADVLHAVHDIDDLWRIRFLTSHPSDMTQRVIDAVAELPRVCPSWELAVQSGDDGVLRRMGRGYRIAEFRELAQGIRDSTDVSAINTDIIVGFPGETKEQFQNTLALVREMRFDLVHVAAYSPRPGTPAARLDDNVPPEEKERRRAQIDSVQEGIAEEINQTYLNHTTEILVDGRQRGRWRGRTSTNKLVFFESDEDWLGKLAQVRVTWTGAWSMLGDVLEQSEAP